MSKIIGLDLDGIIIDKPPIITKRIIEYLYKDHCSSKLSYRFPSLFEQKIRLVSHLPFLRPAINKNLHFFRQCAERKDIHLYIISGRFSFLKKRTFNWLKNNRILNLFQKVYLNTQNQEPHIFKKSVLQKNKVDVFIDDDPDTLLYLAPLFPKIRFYLFTQIKDQKISKSNLTTVTNLKEIKDLC